MPPKSPKKIKTPVRVKPPKVGVKKVQVKAPHVSYKNSPMAKLLGLHESSSPLLMRGR